PVSPSTTTKMLLPNPAGPAITIPSVPSSMRSIFNLAASTDLDRRILRSPRCPPPLPRSRERWDEKAGQPRSHVTCCKKEGMTGNGKAYSEGDDRWAGPFRPGEQPRGARQRGRAGHGGEGGDHLARPAQALPRHGAGGRGAGSGDAFAVGEPCTGGAGAPGGRRQSAPAAADHAFSAEDGPDGRGVAGTVGAGGRGAALAGVPSRPGGTGAPGDDPG